MSSLIDAIDNSIDNIPDLDTITYLITLKVSLQDKIDEINELDAGDPKIDSLLEKVNKMLSEEEKQRN